MVPNTLRSHAKAILYAIKWKIFMGEKSPRDSHFSWTVHCKTKVIESKPLKIETTGHLVPYC